MTITYLGGSRIQGVSGDTKPTNVEVGSVFVETNTQKTYRFYDGAGTTMPSAATGGTITTDGDYKVHTFTDDGTFTVTARASREPIKFLVIGGGATGAYNVSLSGNHLQAGAGGGAGGFREITRTTLATGTNTFAIVIGQGVGNGNLSTSTTFAIDTDDYIRANQGGQGQGHVDADWARRGGGSGGGFHYSKGNMGGFIPPEGYAGGQSLGGASQASHGGGGGGGGAGGYGGSAGENGAMGGNGRTSEITGTKLWYAAGGSGAGGQHGGSDGAANNTGGGGAGESASFRDSSQVAGANAGYGSGGGGHHESGYDGVCIIRYKFQNFKSWQERGTPFISINQLDGVYY